MKKYGTTCNITNSKAIKRKHGTNSNNSRDDNYNPWLNDHDFYAVYSSDALLQMFSNEPCAFARRGWFVLRQLNGYATAALLVKLTRSGVCVVDEQMSGRRPNAAPAACDKDRLVMGNQINSHGVWNELQWERATGKPGLFMNRSAFIKTCVWKRRCGYLAQNTAQISRNALASGLCDDCSNRGLAACG